MQESLKCIHKNKQYIFYSILYRNFCTYLSTILDKNIIANDYLESLIFNIWLYIYIL